MNNLWYGNGVFYNEFGMISEDDVLKDIYDTVGQFIQENLAARSKSILECVKIEANRGAFHVNQHLIPFRNGDMYITKKGWIFHENKRTEVPYRLSVDFRSLDNILPSPHFDKWLDDLFEEEDQLTLQEYLGYCLPQMHRRLSSSSVTVAAVSQLLVQSYRLCLVMRCCQ